jgi:uncharacterized RDD family membrane protein YckC
MSESLLSQHSPVLAGIGRRLCALCYEIVLLSAVVLVSAGIFQLIFPPVSVNAGLKTALFIYEVGLVFVYFGFCWVKGEQTLAMKTWRIRLRHHNGQALNWRQALMRYTMVFIAVMPVLPVGVWVAHQALPFYYAWIAAGWAVLPYAWAGVDKDKQFLHDRLIESRLEFTPRPSYQHKQGKQ